MESIALVLCLAATATAQLLHPISTMGMGMGWGNPMLHSGVRYPGMAQTSQVSSMTYPTWRSHPLFRMVPSVSEKNMGTNLPSDAVKVPSSQEVLTHMALANPNPKQYLDYMADFFYEPQKARTIVTPIVASLGPLGSSAYSQGMNQALMRAAATLGDDCVPQDTRWERGMDWLY